MSFSIKCYLVLWVLLGSITLPVMCQSVNKGEDLSYYLNLNESELRLPEYKDSEEILKLKFSQMQRINATRLKYKQAPLRLDIFASRYANLCSQEALKGGYSGHFNLKGESPMVRWAEVGGEDHIAENAARWSGDVQIKALSEMALYMEQAHKSMMAEKAPEDHHKLTIIDKYHNYVGLGFAFGGDKVIYYEEFIDRYLTFKYSSVVTPKGVEVQLFVKPLQTGLTVFAEISYLLPKLKKLTAKEINQISSYSDYSPDIFRQTWPWDISVPNDEGFTKLSYVFKKSGSYYVNIYLSDKPFKSGKAETKGKIQASGIILKCQ